MTKAAATNQVRRENTMTTHPHAEQLNDCLAACPLKSGPWLFLQKMWLVLAPICIVTILSWGTWLTQGMYGTQTRLTMLEVAANRLEIPPKWFVQQVADLSIQVKEINRDVQKLTVAVEANRILLENNIRNTSKVQGTEK
jgi:hypothetical protein